jgi:hypothetical protein
VSSGGKARMCPGCFNKNMERTGHKLASRAEVYSVKMKELEDVYIEKVTEEFKA